MWIFKAFKIKIITAILLTKTFCVFNYSCQKAKLPLSFLTQDPENDQKMLEIFMDLLFQGKLSKTRNDFLFEVVKSHLQNTNAMDEKIGQLFAKLQVE
jgi:hypothetical protein